MAGHIDAPIGKPLHLSVAPADGARLAYYSVEPGLATLAPRGWHCINIYGSNGADLFVTPHLMDANAVDEAFQTRKLTGPAVILSFSNGFTSGRMEVSSVVSRVFPAHRRYLREAAEVDQAGWAYQGPFPSDKLKYFSRESLEFVTPAQQQGLGTLLVPLTPTDQPIVGVQVLVKDRGDCCDLISLSALLPAEYSDLVPIIERRVQLESKNHH